MKLQYFKQDKPDIDDLVLIEMKRRRKVPKRCLLGGEIVRMNVEQKIDPCSLCGGPREKCGGRPRATADEMANNEERARLTRLLTLEE